MQTRRNGATSRRSRPPAARGRRAHLAAWLAPVLWLAAAPAPAAADLEYRAVAGGASQEIAEGDGPTGPLGDAVQYSDADGLGSASAQVDYGDIGLVAGAELQGPVAPPATITAFSDARWTDQVTLVSGDPALFQAPVTVTFSLQAGGTLSVDTGGAETSNTHAAYSLDVSVGSDDQRIFGSITDEGTAIGVSTNGTQPPTGFFPSYAVNFDIPFDLTVAAAVETQVVADAEGALSQAAADLGGSFEWAGIVEVVDGLGTPVTDYTVTSQSGFDYAVPEPSATLLVAVGGAVLLAARRRK
jgi:hypothetical protein